MDDIIENIGVVDVRGSRRHSWHTRKSHLESLR